MARHDLWKLPLLLVVVGAHLWLGWMLALYRPSQPRSPTVARPSVGESEVLMVLDFPPPPSRAAGAGRFARTQAPPLARGRAHRADAPAPLAGTGMAVVEATGREPALALEFRPGAAAAPKFSAPDPLRRRAALEFQSTRFDHAWMSDGDLKHVVARRSKVASMLLGALGALREPCTERQREQYDVDCLPDQYRHPGPGE
jgi:hypothetical protein